MNKLIIIGLVVLAHSLHLQHTLWNNKDEQLAKISDINWNYCDMKCLYLENYLSGADFVILNFEMVGTQDLYADCYLKKEGEFIRWDQAIKNTLYSKICNDQSDKDLLKMEEYKLTSIEGEGIGTEL